jgi:hypothetical protein
MRTYFESLTDPRRREPTYPLENTVVMLCAVVCGADDFVAVARWANTKKDWLAKFLDMSSGVPSHDRFNAVVRGEGFGRFQKFQNGWNHSVEQCI